MSMDNNTNIHSMQCLYISLYTQYAKMIAADKDLNRILFDRGSFIKNLLCSIKLLMIL